MATPKTKTQLLDTVFQDSQLPGSITASDMRDLVESIPYLQPLGWEFLYDNTTTINLLADTPTKIVMTPNASLESRYPSDFVGAWDKVNNRLKPALLNGAGIIRLSFQGVYTGGTAPHYDLFLDSGSDPIVGGTLPTDPLTLSTGTASNIIYADSPNFQKGATDPQWFNFIIPLFVGPDFATNGAQFVITSHGAASDISNIAVSAFRIFAPNPAGEG